LISQAFNNRTKMGVVRLCQRKGGERARKRSEIGLPAGPRGSDEWPQMPAFCGVPAADDHREKNVPTGETGGGRAIRTLGTAQNAAPEPSAQPRSAGARPARAELLIFADGKGLEAALPSIWKGMPVQRCQRAQGVQPVGPMLRNTWATVERAGGKPAAGGLATGRGKLAQKQYFQQKATLLAANVLTFSQEMYCQLSGAGAPASRCQSGIGGGPIVIAGNLAPPAERPDTDAAPGLIELRSPPGCASGAESRISTE
jgi:hypothetical protein